MTAGNCVHCADIEHVDWGWGAVVDEMFVYAVYSQNDSTRSTYLIIKSSLITQVNVQIIVFDRYGIHLSIEL